MNTNVSNKMETNIKTYRYKHPIYILKKKSENTHILNIS